MEAFFSGTEIALISVSRPKFSTLIKKGKKGALLLEELFKSPSKLYGTTSLGTNIFVVTGTAVTTAYFTGVNPERADLWSILIMTPVTLLFGEIFPKAFFQRFTDTLTYYVVYPLSLFRKLFSPVLWVTSGIVRVLLRQEGAEEIHDLKRASQEEIRRLFTMGQQEFDLHPEEMKMIHNVFELRHSTVEQCMVPLINISTVTENEPINSVRTRLHESGFSRLPVYSDKIYNIAGIITAFDVLRYSKGAMTAKDLTHPAFYVYRKRKVADLLPEMQQAGVRIAVVVNEYSAAIGIVTLEDLLEEIFGEIEDEYDTQPPQVEVLGTNHWSIHANTEIDTVNDEYGWDLPEGDYETVAGYILTQLDRIPAKGETVEMDGFTFLVLEGTHRGFQKIEVFRKKGTSIKNDKKADG
jgi:CBS domain containing-hemolysin-like protein